MDEPRTREKRVVGAFLLVFWAGCIAHNLDQPDQLHKNKIGWLGAVAVSGLNGSPGASVTAGAEGGGSGETNHFPANAPHICTLCQLSLYSMSGSEFCTLPCMSWINSLRCMGRATVALCGARLFCASRNAKVAPPATDCQKECALALS